MFKIIIISKYTQIGKKLIFLLILTGETRLVMDVPTQYWTTTTIGATKHSHACCTYTRTDTIILSLILLLRHHIRDLIEEIQFNICNQQLCRNHSYINTRIYIEECI